MLQDEDVLHDDTVQEGIDIIVESLETYFNHGLRQFLLYAVEVPLCDAYLGNKRRRVDAGDGRDGQEGQDAASLQPVDLYGVEHLVRLLIKLPDLVCVQMMALPVESARYIVAVEDRLMELMAFIVDGLEEETVDLHQTVPSVIPAVD